MRDRDISRPLWLLALAIRPTASSCSTPVLMLTSRRISRTVPLSFMKEVGTVLLHWSGLRQAPSGGRFWPAWPSTKGRHRLGGVVLRASRAMDAATTGRAAGRRPGAGAGHLGPAAEHYLILPWRQPVLIMQTPTGSTLLVHL